GGGIGRAYPVTITTRARRRVAECGDCGRRNLGEGGAARALAPFHHVPGYAEVVGRGRRNLVDLVRAVRRRQIRRRRGRLRVCNPPAVPTRRASDLGGGIGRAYPVTVTTRARGRVAECGGRGRRDLGKGGAARSLASLHHVP